MSISQEKSIATITAMFDSRIEKLEELVWEAAVDLGNARVEASKSPYLVMSQESIGLLYQLIEDLNKEIVDVRDLKDNILKELK
jgi:hypothetical protein